MPHNITADGRLIKQRDTLGCALSMTDFDVKPFCHSELSFCHSERIYFVILSEAKNLSVCTVYRPLSRPKNVFSFFNPLKLKFVPRGTFVFPSSIFPQTKKRKVHMPCALLWLYKRLLSCFVCNISAGLFVCIFCTYYRVFLKRPLLWGGSQSRLRLCGALRRAAQLRAAA